MNSFFGSTLSDAQAAITRDAEMQNARRMAAEQGLRDMLMQTGRLGAISREAEAERAFRGGESAAERASRMEAERLRDALARYQAEKNYAVGMAPYDQNNLDAASKRKIAEAEALQKSKEADAKAERLNQLEIERIRAGALTRDERKLETAAKLQREQEERDAMAIAANLNAALAAAKPELEAARDSEGLDLWGLIGPSARNWRNFNNAINKKASDLLAGVADYQHLVKFNPVSQQFVPASFGAPGRGRGSVIDQTPVDLLSGLIEGTAGMSTPVIDTNRLNSIRQRASRAINGTGE
jgi:hypothetical protein